MEGDHGRLMAAAAASVAGDLGMAVGAVDWCPCCRADGREGTTRALACGFRRPRRKHSAATGKVRSEHVIGEGADDHTRGRVWSPRSPPRNFRAFSLLRSAGLLHCARLPTHRHPAFSELPCPAHMLFPSPLELELHPPTQPTDRRRVLGLLGRAGLALVATATPLAAAATSSPPPQRRVNLTGLPREWVNLQGQPLLDYTRYLLALKVTIQVFKKA